MQVIESAKKHWESGSFGYLAGQKTVAPVAVHLQSVHLHADLKMCLRYEQLQNDQTDLIHTCHHRSSRGKITELEPYEN
jgi:hypothetical protein